MVLSYEMIARKVERIESSRKLDDHVYNEHITIQYFDKQPQATILRLSLAAFNSCIDFSPFSCNKSCSW